MKRVLHYTIPEDSHPHAVPRGVPVAFGGFNDNGVDSWWEVMVPGHEFDPDEYEPATQWVQIVDTGAGLPDGWQHLASHFSEGWAIHLYRVPDREVESRG